MWYEQVHIAFVDRVFLITNLNFQFITLWHWGLSSIYFAQLSFGLTSSIFWQHLKFYRVSHKLRYFWYFSQTIFDNIWRYLTIFDDIQRRECSHLKPANCRPKNNVKYLHFLSSGKQALNQNIMNLERLNIFL